MRSVAALLTFAVSAFAYSVTEPSNPTVWTNGDSTEVVSWTKVVTDPANFTIVLVNQHVDPPTQQVLATLVDGSMGSVAVIAPRAVAGQRYQVNLVQDAQHLDSILAQSGEFTITN
ncbi:hypothetical protein A0H81_03768 [Grifola frondosa]|uniref:Yeast cell wall synthesis Kre9/Knh1-like N-terminal domain-containing protein n=1 Tax=Grifola frondosa TaxID=5627 RepID=A0A1C7MHW4_GRIFR|nr:hypothetical protein A0H81_03768 [Grifola frondosa]